MNPMPTERIDALESLMRTVERCLRFSYELVHSFRLECRLLRKRQILPHDWVRLGKSVEYHTSRLAAAAEGLSPNHFDLELYHVVEEANLDFLKPVRFYEHDFLTATEAAFQIAESLVEHCGAILDWPDWPDLKEADRLKDCRSLLKQWRPLTDTILRDWCLQAEIECRRAIRDEYEWRERQEAGEVPEGQARPRDRVAARRRRVRELRKQHATENDWTRLAMLANADDQILALGLPDPITNETSRNDCAPRRGRRR
jgi:hypothetical protein